MIRDVMSNMENPYVNLSNIAIKLKMMSDYEFSNFITKLDITLVWYAICLRNV